jgi:hypothetical protein
VRFEVDSPTQFERIISKEFKAIKEIDVHDDFVEFEVEKKWIPEINSLVVKKGLNVSAIEQKRKLEDYFIKMIQNQD